MMGDVLIPPRIELLLFSIFVIIFASRCNEMFNNTIFSNRTYVMTSGNRECGFVKAAVEITQRCSKK